VPDAVAAAANLTRKALSRLLAVRKPFVRMARRRARAAQHEALVAATRDVEREIAHAVAGSGPVVAGPWLGEVGYEALYWLPFLRWVQDRYRLAPGRLIAVSRGGVDEWYRPIASRYVDLFDLLSPAELAARNEARQAAHEGGGRKQSRRSDLDDWILQRVAVQVNERVGLLHPSLMFRLFREVWQGNLPLDFLFTRATFAPMPPPPRPAVPGLPQRYVAVKFYNGASLPDDADTREALRQLIEAAAGTGPVVALDTGLAIDDHRDLLFDDRAGVISARAWMTPRTNLGVQTALIAQSSYFLGTCGGLAWLAPFLNVPTVAVYADDVFLRPHLTVETLATRRVPAAEFTTVDLRALRHLGRIRAR
jgi:hypothetical protein